MKKLLVLIFLFSMVVSSVAFGASARWQAMGNEHRFIIDTSNYGPYPARLHQFTNAVWLIPRTAYGDNDIAAGLLMKLGNNMTGAFHFGYPMSSGTSKLASTLKAYGDTNKQLSGLDLRTFPDLFWTMKTGTTTIGARVALTMDKSSSTKPTETSTSATAIDVNVGTLLAMPFGDVDLGVGIGKQSFSDEAGGKTIAESTGGLSIGVDARLNMPKGKQYTIVPILSVKMITDPTESGATEVSSIGGDLGVGVRYGFENKVGKGLVQTGLILGYTAVTRTPASGDAVKETTMAPKVIAGTEFPIKPWLIVRGGASATLTSKSNDVSSMDVAYYYNSGIRIIYGSFILDLILNRDLFHRGPYFVSGSGKDGSNLATNICLTYAFQ